jgi:UPF0755 protein
MTAKSTTVKLTLKVTSFIVRLLLNIVFYVLVVLLIINISKKAFEFTYEIYGPVTVDEAPGRDIIFQIAKGESRMDIASKLEMNRAIKNKYTFFLKTKLQEYVIMPGTYVINSSMTYDDILAVITDYSKSIVQDKAATDQDKDSTKGMNDSKNSDTNAGDPATTDAASDTENNTNTDAGSDTNSEKTSQ